LANGFLTVVRSMDAQNDSENQEAIWLVGTILFDYPMLYFIPLFKSLIHAWPMHCHVAALVNCLWL
jgi:hypothetical protein